MNMVNSANRESGRAASTVHRVVESAKQLLARMLNKPRSLLVRDQNGEVAHPSILSEWNLHNTNWDPLPQVPASVSGRDPLVTRWKRDVEIDHQRRSVMMAQSRDGEERMLRDPLLPPDNTLCLSVCVVLQVGELSGYSYDVFVQEPPDDRHPPMGTRCVGAAVKTCCALTS